MYSAFVWRADSPGHDELRCVLFLINGTVVEDHLRERGWFITTAKFARILEGISY